MKNIFLFIRYILKQAVLIHIQNGFFDGFLKELSESGVSIYRLKDTTDGKSLFVESRDLEKTMLIAQGNGIELSVRQNLSLKHFAFKNAVHIPLAAGLLLFVFYLAFFTSRIYSIEVFGNSNMTKKEITDICSEYGLYIGTNKKSIDKTALLSRLKASEKINWASVNLEGSTAYIEIRENNFVQKEKIPEKCNVTALFTGKIIYCDVYKGTPVITKGAEVQKGDLLISGIVEYDTNRLETVCANGKITGVHDVTLKTDSKKKTHRKYTRQITRYGLYIFGKELYPFSRNKANEEENIHESFLCLNNVVMPFGIIIHTYSSFIEEEEKPSKLSLLSQYSDMLYEMSIKGEIITQRTEYNNDCYSGEIRCAENIAKYSEIKEIKVKNH